MIFLFFNFLFFYFFLTIFNKGASLTLFSLPQSPQIWFCFLFFLLSFSSFLNLFKVSVQKINDTILGEKKVKVKFSSENKLQ